MHGAGSHFSSASSKHGLPSNSAVAMYLLYHGPPLYVGTSVPGHRSVLGHKKSTSMRLSKVSRRMRGILYALAAAVMFGASTPFVRPALASTDTAAAAGYLYLGQAILLSALWLAGRFRARRAEADLGRRDLGPLLAGIVAGGLLAP